MIRVVLTGSESTGKTTLTRELAERLGCVWSEEYVREFALRKAELGAGIDALDVDAIAQGQLAGEERALREARALRAGLVRAAGERGTGRAGVVLHDADLLSTIVYARHYFGACPAWIEQVFALRPADLYLLMGIDLPWVADGVRDRGAREERELLQEMFRAEIAARGLRCVEIEGFGEERVRRAEAAVRGMM